MSNSDTNLEVSVWRTRNGTGLYETFEVPAHDNQTILDVVSWIQQNADPTLTYRFACRVGMCGSCAMMVNGAPRWTCRTHVNKVLKHNRLKIAPLRNLPVIKDLVTDMDPFFDKWVSAGGRHEPTRTRHDPIEEIQPANEQRAAADAGIECINCSVCYAACDTVANNADYLGPAALQRAWTIVNDEKHGDRQDVLDTVSAAGGCQNCHSMGNCTALCPNGLDPLSAIAGLKRATMRQFFKRGN
ncbi:2Fe-2S iron-sulfur cluster-binding protein [Paracoccus sp. Z330]|uniref:Succinate dehydrogenase iron-sulfur subunit n=1 Tax=Paracoccus onchidii TaxID=3017813 RepID=A0ABT4ZAE4_9RHOB|nr:2Fe-2S iron-sulfur cluster-binding protein [Paracoccus onchidii]MDB6176232.1 2Fe-2S iron-sulfur cluster-binding protein [Paracoccus onchidii]